MKYWFIYALLLVAMAACKGDTTNDNGCTIDGVVCIDIQAGEPIQFGEPITLTINVASTEDISGLTINLYSGPPILFEEVNSWVDNGVSWVIDIEANQPQIFIRRVLLPEKDGFYYIISSANSAQIDATFSLLVYQKDGLLTIYYPGTPIPITPGPLSTTNPSFIETLRAMPSPTAWPTLTPYPTILIESTSTPYPPPVDNPGDNPYP